MAKELELESENDKPDFVCEHYPNCPRRQEIVPISDEDEDDAADFSSSTSKTVFGPCEVMCYLSDLDAPTNHCMWVIIGGRVVDVGS